MSDVIVRVRNVSKRFNRDGFEVVAWTTSISNCTKETFWR